VKAICSQEKQLDVRIVALMNVPLSMKYVKIVGGLSMRKRRSTQEILAQIAISSPGITLTEEYRSYQASIQVSCDQCHRKWRTCVRKLSKGRGCYYCKRPQADIKRRLPAAEALSRIAKVHDNEIEVIGDYQSATSPILVCCKQCDREWKTTPQRLYQGKGCEPCGKKRAGMAKRLTIEEVRSRIHPDIILLGEYQGKEHKIHSRCRKCQHEWHPFPGNLLGGDMCPKCEDKRSSERMRLTQEEVIVRLREVSPKIEVHGRYQRAHDPIAVSCRECGYAWTASPWPLLNGGGCPACAGYGFQPDKPATFYYLKVTNPCGVPLFKIGITNRSIEQRFKGEVGKFEKLLEAKFSKGINARKLEQALLKGFALYAYTGPPVLSGGNSELFTKDILNLDAASNNPHVTEMHYDPSDDN
jgi:hypothetical protein